MRSLLFALLFLSVTVASAQGYTIQTPGEMPTYVTPNYGGGYTIQTPGEMPTYVYPNR